MNEIVVKESRCYIMRGLMCFLIDAPIIHIFLVFALLSYDCLPLLLYFVGYYSWHFLLSFIITATYIKKIYLINQNMICIVILHKDKEENVYIDVNKIRIEIFHYRYRLSCYMKIKCSGNSYIKQYNYGCWTLETMQEVAKKIEEAKKSK